MAARGALVLALAAVAAGAGAESTGGGAAVGLEAGPDPGTCELGRVDRAATPSRVCMSCHDGTAGAAVGFSMRAGGGGMDHPVGVDYAAAAARRPGRYVPAGAVPRSVPLVDGRVECTSCHDGASSSPSHVAAQPQLCYACHRL
jgi:predicted CXXCH cytochrome family protein